MLINFSSRKLREKNPTQEEMQMIQWTFVDYTKISWDRTLLASQENAAAGNGINLFLSPPSPRKCTRLIISKPSLNEAKLTVYHRGHIRSGNKGTGFPKGRSENEIGWRRAVKKMPVEIMPSVRVTVCDTWSERICSTRHSASRFAAAYVNAIYLHFLRNMRAVYHPSPIISLVWITFRSICVNTIPLVRVKLPDAEINPIRVSFAVYVIRNRSSTICDI